MTLGACQIDEFHIRASTPSPDLLSVLDGFGSGTPVIIGQSAGCVMALHADAASTSAVASLIRHGSGLIFVAMHRDRLRKLDIPEIATDQKSQCPHSYVAVDAADGIGTGISATDRAETIRRLGDPVRTAQAFRRPGHVIPVAGDLAVGTVPAPPQVALMLAVLLNNSTPVTSFSALVSVAEPYEIAMPAEGARIAAELEFPYVDAAAIIRAFYES